MTTSNRRGIIAAMGASLALAGLAAPVRASAAARRVLITHEAFTLRRRLERQLGGGASLIVTRDWKASIAPTTAGARIVAEQVDCTVEAPPALAALAEIERERKVTGLFPMELGRDGLIASWNDSKPGSVANAIEAASNALEAVAVDSDLKQDARTYWATIGKTAAEFVSQVPRDLFFPETGTRTQRRDLTLPDGGAGSYEITISAQACQDRGLLKTSERRIVTRIGSTSRTASESWSILR